ncbi:ATP-binding cassette domain-containing protein [Natronosporangium hydrolyticum]|uniref:ATP-binding cassette domain-containing protein n=1 Tax=Natronosporangium hydrolyticum TaxID=2811111 RepID=A0A895YQJ3_9ACTN|nr:ATP-binding cassette domain-containing protein [Natronosporangium hydrolyticum]
MAQVFDRPRHPYTRELLAAQPRLRSAVTVAQRVPALTAAPARTATPSAEVPAEVPAASPDPAPDPETEVSGAGLVVTGLTASHRAPGRVRRRNAVGRIDLTVPAGGCLAVVGPSGGGKTTLARCLAGLHPPETGTVTVAGEPLPPRLAQRSSAQRRRVQYVFQDPRASFVADRPVLDQVARTAVRLRRLGRGNARAEATALLATLGVDEVTARRRPDQLSGGELQRAALARALLAEPDVLICDEVTAALDTFTQASVSALLASLAARNDLALVVISHDLALVEQLADRVAVIADGALVELGTAEQVLTQPRHRITRELRDAARR